VFTVLVVLTVLGFSWQTVRSIQGKRYMARWQAENAAFVAAAPSRENLPPLMEQPVEDVFIAKVDRLTLSGQGSVRREIPRLAPAPWQAQPPMHLVYFASYDHSSHDDSSASITIWQYPTAEWARYEARHVSGCTERVVGTHRVLFSEIESWWYSGTKVIRLSAQQPDVDLLFKAYLEKYPSTIEPSFPLFSQLRQK
jgi:hypothetical protein